MQSPENINKYMQDIINECQKLKIDNLADLTNDNGESLLHIAVKRKNVALVKLLHSENLVNQHLPDNMKRLPIHVACQLGDTDMVKYFFNDCKIKVELNCRTSINATLLHMACLSGNITLVTYLLEKGHKVNVVDFFGFTPLHDACTRNNSKLVDLLLKNGADIDAKINKYQLTPLDFARKNGHSLIVSMIEGFRLGQKKDGPGTTVMTPERKSWRKVFSGRKDKKDESTCSTERVYHDSKFYGCNVEDAYECRADLYENPSAKNWEYQETKPEN